MGNTVFFWYGMSTHYYFHVVFFLDRSFKVVDVGAGWITDHKAGGKMNNFCTVLFHFFGGIFYIASWASTTTSVTNQLHIFFVNIKCTFPILKCPETFATCTSPVAGCQTLPVSESQRSGCLYTVNISYRISTYAIMRKFYL